MFKEKNKKSSVNEKINTKDLEFMPLKDFIGKTLRAWGFFFTSGKFGKQCVLVAEEYVKGEESKNEYVLVNLPKRYYEEFSQFSEDEVTAIVNGDMLITDIEEFTSDNGKTVIFTYDDI